MNENIQDIHEVDNVPGAELSDTQTAPEQQVQPQQPAPQKPSAEEINFRKMRQDRDEAMRRLSAMESEIASLRNKSSEVHDPHPDDLVEGKHLSKIDRRIKELEERFTASSAEMALKIHYPDFDAVVSVDNIQELSRQFPELAKSVNSNPNLYDKAVATYTLIKRFGIGGSGNQQPGSPLAELQRQQVVNNATKPRSSASVSSNASDSPLTQANRFSGGLTDTLKQELFKEMNAAIKNWNQ